MYLHTIYVYTHMCVCIIGMITYFHTAVWMVLEKVIYTLCVTDLRSSRHSKAINRMGTINMKKASPHDM